jgi:hypothetical protein
MNTNAKVLLSSGLVICAAATMTALRYQAASERQQQVEFITNFYKNYLARPWSGRSNILPIGVFYSTGADALLTTNFVLCQTLSRGDNICGYGADGDVFLNGQEIDPDLTFEKARFQAIASGTNTVDVSFNVYPELGSDYGRKIRYVFVKEAAGWRVDDVVFGDGGRFPAEQSLRNEVRRENEAVLAQARDIVDVARWVSAYLSRDEMLDRAERFVSKKVLICSEGGGCESVGKDEGSAKLRGAMQALHQAYHADDSDRVTELGDFAQARESPAEGESVQIDALAFTFRGKAWWITKIDLGQLGRTVPVRRRLTQAAPRP